MLPKHFICRSLACVALAGCGDNPRPAPRRAAAEPALLRNARGPGEIVVRGEASPASHGPFAFRGRYVVRFEQYAPEDPRLDFGRQTSFVAALDRAREQTAPGSVRLFRTAARRGRRRVTLHGRFFVDVGFGDYPYVIRFTPDR